MAMDEKQLLEILKNRLSIRITEGIEQYIGKGIRVSLYLDDEEVSSDYVTLNYWGRNKIWDAGMVHAG